MSEGALNEGAAEETVGDDTPALKESAGGTNEEPTVGEPASEENMAAAEAVLQQSFDGLAGDPPKADLNRNLNAVLNIPVVLSMELGRTQINIRDLLQLGEGSVVRLDRPAGDPLDILVNDCLVARGEVVVINDRFGIRVTDILSPEERVKRLR